MGITRKQAESALAQVREQFASHIIEKTGSGPELVENWKPFRYRNGKTVDTEPVPFAIVWPEGPDDWAYRAQDGGRDYELTMELRAALNSKTAAIDTPPARNWPEGVRGEPYYSYVFGLYED